MVRFDNFTSFSLIFLKYSNEKVLIWSQRGGGVSSKPLEPPLDLPLTFDDCILIYRNDPKFSDRLIWANNADPVQTAPRGAV